MKELNQDQKVYGGCFLYFIILFIFSFSDIILKYIDVNISYVLAPLSFAGCVMVALMYIFKDN